MMTEIEKKELIARLRARTDPSTMLTSLPPRPAPDRDCHAAADLIEADMAFRQEVSDAVVGWKKGHPNFNNFDRFIIDPLVEALAQYRRTPGSGEYVTPEKRAEVLRAVLAARGLKIVEDK